MDPFGVVVTEKEIVQYSKVWECTKIISYYFFLLYKIQLYSRILNYDTQLVIGSY